MGRAELSSSPGKTRKAEPSTILWYSTNSSLFGFYCEAARHQPRMATDFSITRVGVLIFVVEGVYGIFEVKQTLDKAAKHTLSTQQQSGKRACPESEECSGVRSGTLNGVMSKNSSRGP